MGRGCRRVVTAGRPASPLPRERPMSTSVSVPFISYAHADQRRVHALVHDLTGLGHTPWFDRAILPGQAWWEEICGHIRDCSFFVFAISRASTRSAACQRELSYAMALRKPVLPVLVGER